MKRMEKNGVEVLPKNVVAAQHSDLAYLNMQHRSQSAKLCSLKHERLKR